MLTKENEHLLSVNFLGGNAVCNYCRSIGHFLCGAERAKSFVYVNLRCTESNLKRIA